MALWGEKHKFQAMLIMRAINSVLLNMVFLKIGSFISVSVKTL